jgi:hypothetical protein
LLKKIRIAKLLHLHRNSQVRLFFPDLFSFFKEKRGQKKKESDEEEPGGVEE